MPGYLKEADLTPGEHRTIERLRSSLIEELGTDLQALWLYGSRARGETRQGSDVDLMVVVGEERPGTGRIAGDLGEAAARIEGESPFAFSVHTHDLRWLEGRRDVESFFIREVDRDKIVLAGSALDR